MLIENVNVLIHDACIHLFRLPFFQESFEFQNRYREDLEGQEIKIKTFLRHVDSFELICLLTEYLICGDLDTMVDDSEDLT